MVKNTLKVITATFGICLAMALSVVDLPNTKAVSNNTNLEVNVQEALSVTVTTPSTWASGNINQFLRNKVSISVVSNNASGFTASMTAQTTETSLLNSYNNTISLPTLSSNTTHGTFPANFWGYSLDDTDAGLTSSTYSAMVGSDGTPITLLSSNSAASLSKDFFFGAKADATKAAGTYAGTVVINVVAGVNVNPSVNPLEPINPTNPINPVQPIYTSGTSGDYTPDVIGKGDTIDLYEGYNSPQGVTYKTGQRVSTSTTAASGLAAAATLAATSGIFLFVLVKKKDEEDDDEEEQQLQ